MHIYYSISLNPSLNKKFEMDVVEKIKTDFMFNNIFSQNRAVYETTWENMMKPDRPQMTT
jgi:hypothetical protein